MFSVLGCNAHFYFNRVCLWPLVAIISHENSFLHCTCWLNYTLRLSLYHQIRLTSQPSFISAKARPHCMGLDFFFTGSRETRLGEQPGPSRGTHPAQRVGQHSCWSRSPEWWHRWGSSQSPPSSCLPSSCCCAQTRWRWGLWQRAGQRRRSRQFLKDWHWMCEVKVWYVEEWNREVVIE